MTIPVDFCLMFGLDMMSLPCGGVAYYEEESTCHSYRCNYCLAVVGSVGVPRYCKDEAEKWAVQKDLGGEGWDYYKEAE